MLLTISWALSRKKEKKKRGKGFEKWKQRNRLHCRCTFTAIICVFHHPTCRDYKHHLILILQSTIYSRHLLFSIYNLSSMHLWFSNHPFHFLSANWIEFNPIPLPPPKKPLPLPVSRSNNWVSFKLWTWFLQAKHTHHMSLLWKLLRNKVWSMPLWLSVQLGSLTSQHEAFPLSKTKGFSITQEK